MKWIKENFYFLIIVGVIILVVPVGYYYIYALPKLNSDKLNFEKDKYNEEKIQKQQQEEEQKRAELEKQQKEEEQRYANKTLLEDCLQTSEINYLNSWSKNCTAQAKKNRNEYQECLDTFKKYGDEYTTCAWHKNLIDDSYSCSLPSSIADDLGNDRKDSKDECYKKYPQE